MTVIKIVPMPGPQGPAGSGGTETVPLPSFLEWSAGRDHLPALNTNFGWDSNGLWFGDAITQGPWGTPSYPVYTDVVFQEFDKTVVTFHVAIEDYCSDIGVCFYPTGATPNWAWGSEGTRIAAQFDCPNPVIHGMSSSNIGDTNADDIPNVGTYRVVFSYDPNAETDKVVFDTFLVDGNTVTLQSHLTLNEQFELNGGTYKVGFASDNSSNDEAAQNPPYITYISNLTIDVNDGETVYEDSLKNGYSGAAVNLVAPLNIKDANGENLLRIEKGWTGVTRIDALQDDLALRSSRDIILYPGDDGPGNVYIGWGDANYTPNATNKVATLADIPNINTGDITFNGVKIIGAGTAAGDSSGNGTMELVPDADLQTDQYLVIDPTSPNHIHIRAGGTQDASSAQLILGAEMTNVEVSDGDRSVVVHSRKQQQSMAHLNINFESSDYLITTDVVSAVSGWTVSVNDVMYEISDVYFNAPTEGLTTIYAPSAPFAPDGVYNVFSPDGVNTWRFSPNGTLYGPAQGGVAVNSISNDPDFDLQVFSDKSLVLSGNAGEFLNDQSIPSNQIATIGDVNAVTSGGATGSFVSQDGKTITVTNGIITAIDIV